MKAPACCTCALFTRWVPCYPRAFSEVPSLLCTSRPWLTTSAANSHLSTSRSSSKYIRKVQHSTLIRSLRQTAASSLATFEISTMLSTQDHSSFANYLQAAVAHIDLGEHRPLHDLLNVANAKSMLHADLSVLFESKTVGGTAKASLNSCSACARGVLRSQTSLWKRAAACKHQTKRNLRDSAGHQRSDHQQCQ